MQRCFAIPSGISHEAIDETIGGGGLDETGRDRHNAHAFRSGFLGKGFAIVAERPRVAKLESLSVRYISRRQLVLSMGLPRSDHPEDLLPSLHMILHLIDGTYELFRHFYASRRFSKGVDRPYGAVVGVLQTVLQLLETGDTYVGVATDHVIESFRNRLWAGYKTGAGIEPALLAQFHPLEEALRAMGVVVWPMTDLEADDALASAAHLASADAHVEKVAIWTPDKDLAQCVRDARVVQIDGRRKIIRDAAGVREKFGVDPMLIPDLLALVGDAADGYPGIPGIGAKTAARLLNQHGRIEDLPSHILGGQRELALLFKTLATLRTDAVLFENVESLRWRGTTPAFAEWAKRINAPRLLERCEKALTKSSAPDPAA
ncbi:MAG: 5'-3' exonuclease [Chthoniobacteraceae bacterium]